MVAGKGLKTFKMERLCKEWCQKSGGEKLLTESSGKEQHPRKCSIGTSVQCMFVLGYYIIVQFPRVKVIVQGLKLSKL